MTLRTCAIVGAVMTVCAVGAGCGDDGSDTTTTSGTATAAAANGAGGAGLDRAKQVVTEYESERADTALELPKLGSTPKKGVKITILTCPLPACKQTTDGAVTGAKALGWDVTYDTYQLSPEDYVSKFDALAENPPEALTFISAFPTDTIKAQLQKLEAAKVKIIMLAPQTPEKPSPGIPGVVQGAPEFEAGGMLAANKVIADGAGKANAAIVNDPSYGVFNPVVDGWKKAFAENCPDCKLGSLDISLGAPAAQNTAAVVNFVRRNPDTKYLFFSVGDAALGVPQALAAAGLQDQIKLVTLTPNLTDLKQVKDGTEFATIQDEAGTSGFRAVDGLARLIIGEDVGPERYPTGYLRILNQANVVPGTLPVTPGTPEKFYEAWGVAK